MPSARLRGSASCHACASSCWARRTGCSCRLAANPTVFLRTKVQTELGLSPDSGGAAFGDALMVGGTYMGAAVIPLWPYLLFQITPALVVSLACTLVALFALGVAKGRIARMALVRSGAQVLVIGAISAGIGFAVGHVVSAIAG